MDLYEYQGKQYFARFGIPTSPGGVADTVDEAVAQADAAGYPVVVKAQVKVGGRGKAGGVKLAADADEVRLHAGNILGLDIKGHVVKRLWVEHASDIAKEYYASFTLDRPAKLHLGMLSAEGGVEIEEVAETNPDAIAKLHIDPVTGLTEEAAREWVDRANLDPEAREQAATLLVRLYHCYVEGDCDLAEINPLILTPEGKVHALDAKVTLDENASFRHPEWEEFEDDSDVDPREKMAKEKGLNYIGLSGTVGIIANGAGLAMSTLDVVTQVGGQAANFLDIGGGANADVMAAALEVINADPAVKSILVNIFGGITRVDEVAKGIIEAIGRVKLSSPVVMRLDGTNAVEGRALLADAPVGLAHRRAHHARRRPPRRRPGQGLGARRQPDTDTPEQIPEEGQNVSIFVDETTKVVIQGISPTSQGLFHGLRNKAYGTKIVGGTNPKRGGEEIEGIPVFASVAEAVKETGATASFISVPPRGAADAIIEAAEAGIAFIVCITEGIPAQDEAVAYNRLVQEFPGTRLLGPELSRHHQPREVQHRHHLGRHRLGGRTGGHRARARARSPTRPCTSSPSRASGRPPASASAATRCPAPTSSTASPPSRPTPRPRPS